MHFKTPWVRTSQPDVANELQVCQRYLATGHVAGITWDPKGSQSGQDIIKIVFYKMELSLMVFKNARYLEVFWNLEHDKI